MEMPINGDVLFLEHRKSVLDQIWHRDSDSTSLIYPKTGHNFYMSSCFLELVRCRPFWPKKSCRPDMRPPLYMFDIFDPKLSWKILKYITCFAFFSIIRYSRRRCASSLFRFASSSTDELV